MFIFNPNFEKSATSLPGLEGILRQKAERVARRAEQLAPDDPRTGAPDLHTQIDVDVKLTDDGWKARVNDHNFKAAWYEFGTSREDARPYLRPALEAENAGDE